MKSSKVNSYRSFDDRIDEVMINIGLRMIEDFRGSSDSTSLFIAQYNALKRRDIPAYRDVKYNLMGGPTYLFKQGYQLENLYKRHIFKKDVYTSNELRTKSHKDFLDFQAELANKQFVIPQRSYAVVQNARRLAKEILGKVDVDDLLGCKCEFGRRANFGVPYVESYLDVKMEKLTGSPAHRALWSKVVEGDDLLSSIVSLLAQRASKNNSECQALKLASVPKSWKAFRTMCPNTVLGAFFSASLGAQIQTALKRHGLDITRLQSRHGRYAKSASLAAFESHGVRGNVTADMSKASDCFTAQLINRLVPRDWYRWLKYGRSDQVVVDGHQYYMPSFMAMGIGFTFPLETLLFYCVIKSIQQLHGSKGKISVYGDDLIYPPVIHHYVAQVFSDLGFKLNLDKTYKHLPFRESCGSDFHRGVDVRPFSPEYTGGEVKTFLGYQAHLYKLLNGLLRRWSDVEIPRTVMYLLREIVNVGDSVLHVPDDFPDDSGLKRCRLLRDWPLIPWAKPVWNQDFQVLGFSYIRYTPGKRLVRSIRPYYWDSLRRAVNSREVGPYDSSESNVIEYKYDKASKKSKAYCSSKDEGRLLLGCFPSRKNRAPIIGCKQN